jgi:hypothetical protein
MSIEADRASAGASLLKDRVPRLARLIDALQARDEGFREICIELADAHAALGAARSLPPARRRQREREWRDCIGSLVAEACDRMCGPKVVALPPPKRATSNARAN